VVRIAHEQTNSIIRAQLLKLIQRDRAENGLDLWPGGRNVMYQQSAGAKKLPNAVELSLEVIPVMKAPAA
jgi:hypothetical protein